MKTNDSITFNEYDHPFKHLESPLIHDHSMVMESNASDPEYLERKIYQLAVGEIGRGEYGRHIRKLFGRTVLDYAKTLVINLPGPCFSNCSYCIDKDLRKNSMNYDDFLETVRKVFIEKGNRHFKEVSITGGTLPPYYFNKLVNMILYFEPDVKITWNTNGADVNAAYDVHPIKYINLHRNSADDDLNKSIFGCTEKPIISVNDFKTITKDKLCIRVTVDESFDIDNYVKFNTPLYLNRLLPGTPESEAAFDETLMKLNITEDSDIRRRNHYLNGTYKDIPVRLCLGDRMAEHVPDRYPMWLNVIIIHRSGVVAGSWYEDDKFLYKRKN